MIRYIMPQFHIDEVFPKDSVYPIIVSLQNVYVTEKFKSHDCLILEEEETGKKKIFTEICDTIYTGEEENEDLGKTLILARNKITGKVRLIEVGNIELKPVIKSNLDTTEAMDTSYLELSRKFGWKNRVQIMEPCEKIEITVEMGTDQLQKVTEDKMDLPFCNKIDSDEFYIPAINREATKVEEVYDIDKILTPEQFDKIYSEIEGTQYTSNLNPFLKPTATKTLSQKHTVLLVYANTLLQLYRTLMKDINKNNFTACQYSVTLNKIVMDNFLTNINGKRGRSLRYKDKSLCHSLVFILLINSYKFNIDDLCQQLKLSARMVTSKLALTGATVVSVGSKNVAQLKLETKNNIETKTNSIKPISNDKEPISDTISKHKVNRNINKESITRTTNVNNENTYPICNNVNKDEFKCKVCNYKGINNNDIKTHSLCHSSLCTKEKRYICDIYQSSYDRKDSLETHIQIHSKEKPYKCDICQKSFNKPSKLKKHIRIHTGEKPYKCNTCQSSFNVPSDLKKHILIHTGVKPYKCDICQRSFKQSSNLKTHFRIHTGEKPYKCVVCQRTFNKSSNLKKHVQTHTGDKPYNCDICQRRFYQSSDLKKHIRIHTGEKPYECDICQSSFNVSSALKRHILIHTGEKPYKCNICQSSFNKSSNLKTHIRIHTGEKPYKCDICQSSFNVSSALKRHFLIHTGEKPYKCDKCQSSFKQKITLTAHNISKHPV